MDFAAKFQTEVPNFASLMWRISQKVRSLVANDDIKVLKEELDIWSPQQKKSLQGFIAAQEQELKQAISFARTYKEYFKDYFLQQPQLLQNLRWSLYGLLEADFFNHYNLRWLMDLTISNVPEPDKSGVVSFYNSCVIRSIVPLQTDIRPHCSWLLAHFQELMPGQKLSILWHLYRRQNDNSVVACLYQHSYRSCQWLLQLISFVGVLGSIWFGYNLLCYDKETEFTLFLILSLLLFVLPQALLFIFRPHRR